MNSQALPIALLIFAATITPGPNNVLVVSAATGYGVRTTIPVIAAIVCAGAVMILLSTYVSTWLTPSLLAAIRLGGSALLLFFALKAWRRAGATGEAEPAALHSSAGVAAFQFVNPKAWLLMGMLAAAGGGQEALPVVVLLFAMISTASLALWAAAGRALYASLTSDMARLRFDRAMALLLGLAALSFAFTS